MVIKEWEKGFRFTWTRGRSLRVRYGSEAKSLKRHQENVKKPANDGCENMPVLSIVWRCYLSHLAENCLSFGLVGALLLRIGKSWYFQRHCCRVLDSVSVSCCGKSMTEVV